MSKIYKRTALAKSCYDLAVERTALCFDRYDRVAVSFSGGKDSTAVLNVALAAARAAGKLPLDVYTFDEEAIPPETVEYMARVAASPDVRFVWFCLPVEHRNACSKAQPLWHPWAPEDRAKWVRELPPLAVTELKGFRRGMAIPQVIPHIWGPERGTVCHLLGIRTQESMTRYRAVCMKQGKEAFLSGYDGAKWMVKGYPIYDWPVDDVWLAPALMGWDYNHAYDVMARAGLSRSAMRCAPPFGEQPLRGLHRFKTCWPQLWAKMCDRVPGAATAARYANTELYGIGMTGASLPEGAESWEAYTFQLIDQLAPSARADVAKGIQNCIRNHKSRTFDPLPDAEPHPGSGYCWKGMCVIAQIGGNKLDRQAQKVRGKALEARKKRGINT